MIEITSLDFKAETLEQLKKHQFGTDWPAVYFIQNEKEAYIGEAVNVLRRSKEHLQDKRRRDLKRIHVLTDHEFNKSAALDIESSLIQFLSADNKFKLQNGNKGLQNHSYYEREKYQAKFEALWEALRNKGLVKQSLLDLKNSNLFKYSPYKALNEDQLEVVETLIQEILANDISTHLVHGGPGTGKTILAAYLMKCLLGDELVNIKIGLVIPMVSLRKTLKQVFRSVDGLSPKMVLGPSDVFKDTYDLLIVDETHRLKKRVNIPNYQSFDNNNKRLGLGKEGTELDWILANSKHQVFFYDAHQTIKPSDIDPERFKSLEAKEHTLAQQMRVEGGDEYIDFVQHLFTSKPKNLTTSKTYDVKFFDNLSPMVKAIKANDKKFGLCRLVAGYAWPWLSSKDKAAYDIELEGTQLRWNSCIEGWVNSENAVNEVGCIHTVQGYDLNYVGVIIGLELRFNKEKQKIVLCRRYYSDRNGHVGIKDDEIIHRYVINIYKTLMTRAIKGTYVYVADPDLRAYLKTFF